MATIRLSEISLTRGRRPLPGPLGKLLPSFGGPSRQFHLHKLTLTVPHGQTLVVLGPSGCGKSTLLRIIAGLEAPSSGRVLYNGKDVAGISPGERRIGYLFQSYALYPHLTSKENITSYFLFRRKTPKMVRERERMFRRTSELLDVDISYLLERRPPRLSGGEKQRVALGRCITREPELFLLDEPFTNLDAKLRARYRLHLKALLREFGITTVYVTHDQQEAALLGDLIAVMRMEANDERNEGRLEQIGTVRELYEHPANMFVADFFNLQLDVPSISFLAGHAIAPALSGCTVGVRPEDVMVGSEEGAPSLDAVVTEVRDDPLQQSRVLTLRLGTETLVAKVPGGTEAAVGQRLVVRLRHYHLFDGASGEAIHPEAAAHAALG